MSLALNIVDQTLEAAKKEGALQVLEVVIEVGCLAGVMADALRFCLEAAGPAGGLPETAFKIVEIPGEGMCFDCGSTFAADSFLMSCPDCGGVNVSLSGGRDLKISSLTIED